MRNCEAECILSPEISPETADVFFICEQMFTNPLKAIQVTSRVWNVGLSRVFVTCDTPLGELKYSMPSETRGSCSLFYAMS